MKSTERHSTAYKAAHRWIKRQRGRAVKCQIDDRHTARYFHWANISREYRHELDDWIQLCPKCHRVFDQNKWTVDQLLAAYRQSAGTLSSVDQLIQSFKSVPHSVPQSYKQIRPSTAREALGQRRTLYLKEHFGLFT